MINKQALTICCFRRKAGTFSHLTINPLKQTYFSQSYYVWWIDDGFIITYNQACGRVRNLREAEEERSGANKEESRRWHWYVAGGSQGSAGWDDSVREGWGGWTPSSTLTAATWHHFLCVAMCVSALQLLFQRVPHSEFDVSECVLSESGAEMMALQKNPPKIKEVVDDWFLLYVGTRNTLLCITALTREERPVFLGS